MKGLGGLLCVIAALSLCGLLAMMEGLWRGTVLPLVRVSGIAPRQVEAGDRVDIAGDGFPPGRPARITFRGTLYRSGEEPETGAEIIANGVVTSSTQVELSVTDDVQALFCRAGDRAVHTTFEGDLQVAFASTTPGAPPVAGTVSGVVFDVRPPTHGAAISRDHEGDEFLAWIGMQVAATPSGLSIASVTAGSRADAAGLAGGMTVVAVDHLRAASAGDLLPRAGARRSAVVVVDGAGVQSTHFVAVDGFRRALPDAFFRAALLVLGALSIVFATGVPLVPPLSAGLQRIVTHVRSGAALGLGAAAREALAFSGTPAILDGATLALLAILPFGQYRLAAQLDAGVLFVAASTAAAMAAAISPFTLGRALQAAAHIALQHAPAALAVAAAVTMTGSLRLQEIAGAQGGGPLEWLAFRSPGTLLAFGLFSTAALVPIGGRLGKVRALGVGAGEFRPDFGRTEGGAQAREGLFGLSEQAEGPRVPAPPAGEWTQACIRAQRVLVAGSASVLFLGGWLVPGLSPAEQGARALFQLMGAACLLGKTLALSIGLAWLRSALPEESLSDGTRRAWLWGVPASLVALIAVAAWSAWGPSAAVQRLVTASLAAFAALAVWAVAQRVRFGVLSPTGDGKVSPFI